MKGLFVCFYMCFVCSLSLSAQHTVTGNITKENTVPLTGVHVMLYPAEDSINHVAIDVTDTLGAFRLPLIPDGEYQLVTKYIGMKTAPQSLTVSGKDLAVGTIRMREADHRLGEVAVEAELPEWSIERCVRIGTRNASYNAPVDDVRNPDLEDFEGRWQWKSAHNDTILTLELFQVELTGVCRMRAVGTGQWYTRRCLRNHLAGRYEYQMGDSILFSCMHMPVTLHETLFLKRRGKNAYQWPPSKNEKAGEFLLHESSFPMPPNGVYLKQNHNPFAHQHAWITLTFVNEEKTALFWHTDVVKRIETGMQREPGKIYVRKALTGELGLPNKIVLKKIDDMKHSSLFPTVCAQQTEPKAATEKDSAVNVTQAQHVNDSLKEAERLKRSERLIRSQFRGYKSAFTTGSTYRTEDARDENLEKFEGRWQWRSADGDTVLTLEIFEIQVSGTFRNRIESICPYWMTIRFLRNHLISRYEYQIGDSVLFSSMHIPVKQRRSFTLERKGRGYTWPKQEREKDFLLNEDFYPVSNNSVYFRQVRNPFGLNHAWITLTRLNEETLFWRMDVLKEVTSQGFIVRKAKKGEYGLPNRIVLKKIGDIGKQKKSKKRKREKR